MGILPTPEGVDKKSDGSKRKSRQLDLSNLSPLKSKGTVGFAGYRDPTAPPSSFALGKNGKSKDDDEDIASDVEDDVNSSSKRNGSTAKEDINDAADDDIDVNLSPEEIARRGELAEGVKKIQVSLLTVLKLSLVYFWFST